MTEPADRRPSERDDRAVVLPSTGHISPATGRLAARVAAELAMLSGRSALGERKGLRVLHCDDEDAVRDVAKRQMEASIPEVDEIVTVGDGATAMARLEQERFDLFMTDERHPGPHGYDLCAAAKALHPSMPVVLATVDLGDNHPQPAPWDVFLQKPWEFDDFTRVIRIALGLPERRIALRPGERLPEFPR